MKCFYHNPDFDGHCSGAIVKKKFDECEMIGINYGDEFPWGDIEPNETVYMVDFALQPFDDMVKLNKVSDLKWIDHHSSAIEEYNKSGIEIEGLRDINFAGCELTWKYLFNDKLPKVVSLLGRFDVWKHNESEDIVPFQYGMQQFEDTSPDNTKFWSQFLGQGFKDFIDQDDAVIKKIVEDGRLIWKYQDAKNTKMCDHQSFETILDGHKAIALNAGLVGSQLFDSIYDKSVHEIMMPFYRKQGYWNVSIYAPDNGIDCGKLAKKYGGGGHKGAAGFQCKKLPFKV